jgi:anti-sigma factor RsiW
MSEHEQVRELMALAAAGGLDAEERACVERHVRGCAECQREFEMWCAYAQGLRELPEVAVPLGLAERTLARMREQNAAAEDRRWNAVVLGGLAAFGWASSVAGWVVVREVAPVSFAAWSVGWMVVAWITAGVAAVVLGGQERRPAL